MGYSLGIWYENERKGRKMRTDKAQKILDAIERRDRKAVKRWKPYNGPADWSFIVLDAAKKELEERMDERPEVSNG